MFRIDPNLHLALKDEMAGIMQLKLRLWW